MLQHKILLSSKPKIGIILIEILEITTSFSGICSKFVTGHPLLF